MKPHETTGKWIPSAVLAGAVLLIGLACSFVGAVSITGEAGPFWAHPLWTMRLARIAVTGVTGLALAAAGAALQGVLRNPLADPFILGISSGAGVGVRIWLLAVVSGLIWAGAWMLPGAAFIGALAACYAVYRVGRQGQKLDPHALILAGVIINTFNTALMMGLYLFTNPQRMDLFARWAMGEIPDITPPGLLLAGAGIALAGWAWLLAAGHRLDSLNLGDDVALSMGLSPVKTRREGLICAGLLTAASVALAGPIGFVGLIVPHICRMLHGPSHRALIFNSGLAGAGLLIAADTLCRLLGQWTGAGKLPVGVLTALAGGPFFLYLLRRSYRRAS